MGIGASLFLLAVGAVLAFAVDIDPYLAGGITIEWSTVGVILMLVGVVGLVWSLMHLNAWRDRNHVVHEVDDPRVVERDRIIER